MEPLGLSLAVCFAVFPPFRATDDRTDDDDEYITSPAAGMETPQIG
jgi:hypothetical protein